MIRDIMLGPRSPGLYLGMLGLLVLGLGCSQIHSKWNQFYVATECESGDVSKRGHVRVSMARIRAGDRAYVRAGARVARDSYEKALEAARSETPDRGWLAAGWRLLVCDGLLGDETARRRHFVRIFGSIRERGDHTQWVMADFIAHWAAGEMSDEDLPLRLDRLWPGSGASRGWFLVGERQMEQGDTKGARSAFESACRADPNLAPWGGTWAKTRLEGLTISSGKDSGESSPRNAEEAAEAVEDRKPR